MYLQNAIMLQVVSEMLMVTNYRWQVSYNSF